MNPRKGSVGIEDGELRIEPEDALIVMAFSAPDLKACFDEP